MKKPLVTEVESVEAARVIEARSKAKKGILVVTLIAAIALFIVGSRNGLNSDQATGMYFGLLIIYLIIERSVHKKYKDLLKLAESNDKIRHEEKVRSMERDRLEQSKEIEKLQQEIERLKSQQ